MLGKLIGGVVSKIVGEGAGTRVVEYFDTKQQLKHEYKLAKLQGKIDAAKATAQYKAEQLRQHGEWSQGMVAQMRGWKDEFVLVLVALPLIFVPVFPDRVLQVFEVLQQTPQWYMYMMMTIFLAVYGIKPAFDKLRFWRK